MKSFLRSDARIGSESGGPYLERVGVPIRHRLAIPEALALTFLVYTGVPRQSAELVSASLANDEGPRWVQRVLDRWAAYLDPAGVSRPPDLEFLRVCLSHGRVPMDGSQRDAAPAAITWLVTLACNRRCPYCFYAVTHWSPTHPESPPDATFPLAAAEQLVQEMGTVGAADLYLTGGEPLLRNDLTTIIAAASSARVRTHITTKYPIDPARARALADARVHKVCVSLDDARPVQADAMAGAHGYFGEATKSIEALLTAGVSLFVNTVVTRINVASISALVEHAVALGVPRLRLSPYSEPFPYRPQAARLAPEPLSLHRLVGGLKEKYGHLIMLEVGPAETPEGSGPCGDGLLCEVGLRSLDVLPDGRVTRCRYMPNESELIVGDLREQTLMEVWEGARLAALSNPPRDPYAGSACHGCGAFDHCNKRGRCFYTAKLHNARLHAPDAWCTNGPPA